MGIDAFVEELFGAAEGIVYTPYRFGKRFYQQFYDWPNEKDKLLEHLHNYKDREIYISPSLFSKRVINPDTFKGTNVLWTEFDGTLPPQDKILVPPSIRIQSSFHGHEHWYWRLNEFVTDHNRIIDLTKRLAYFLEADLSVWDYACVLRPPGTRNQKRSMPVKTLECNDTIYELEAFGGFPLAPNRIDISINKTTLPQLQELIAKYPWKGDAYELITKKVEHPHRSEALARLAFECAEMGMANAEIFVILKDAANRWGKFNNRTDKDRRIEGLISYTRSKKAAQAEIVDTETVIYRMRDFLNTKINLKWVVTNLIPVAGSSVVFGPSTVGKSTFALRLGIAIATGEKQFLEWPIERTQKVLFTSLEMPHDELNYFIKQMQLTDEQIDLLQENFFVWPIGHPYPFDTRDQQSEVLKYIDQFKIDFAIIDSLGEASYGSIKSTDDMKRLYSFMNEDLRKDRKCGYMFVHHPRKPGVGEKNTDDFNEAYGDSYIINRAQTVIVLSPLSGNRIKVSIPKSRLALDQKSFQVVRKPDRSFERVSTDRGKPTAQQERHDELLRDSPGILSFGKSSSARSSGHGK
jgi:hypothetical protein